MQYILCEFDIEIDHSIDQFFCEIVRVEELFQFEQLMYFFLFQA